MGDYTQFRFDATLRRDVPVAVLDYVRRRLTRPAPGQPYPETPLDDHPFFRCERWHWVLTMASCDGHGHKAYCRETDTGLVIHLDTRLKNYCRSIEWFLVWVAPLVNLDHSCTMYRKTDGVRYAAEPEDTDCAELIRRIQQRIGLGEIPRLEDWSWTTPCPRQ